MTFPSPTARRRRFRDRLGDQCIELLVASSAGRYPAISSASPPPGRQLVATAVAELAGGFEAALALAAQARRARRVTVLRGF